ncbi:hypothetical protein C0J52_01145, partial [Blattella germanica]
VVELIPEPEVVEEEPEPEIEFVKKIVEKVIQAPMIHGYFGSIPPEAFNKNRRYFYFLRTCTEGIPLIESIEDAIAEMPRNFLVGSITGKYLNNFLQCLKDSLSQASGINITINSNLALKRPSDFRRLTVVLKRDTSKQSENQLIKKHEARKDSKQDSGQTPTKQIILDELHRLISVVEWTIHHVQGDIMLPIPYIAALHQEDATVQSLAKDKHLIDQLETVIMNWEKHISKIMDSEGPIAEYDYWHEREAGLGILDEQLKARNVMHIFDVLNESGSQIGSGFEHYRNDLIRYYTQARDNVKFLYTVLRHFKILTNSETLPQITVSLFPLMEGMHMLWVLSRYYGTDEKMVPLMERIAWMLCHQAKSKLDNTKLFQKPKPEIQQLCTDAKEMLSTWKKAYYATQADFDLFDSKFELNWQEMLGRFKHQVCLVESEATHFIDQSFKELRSSEEALDLLLKFKHINTRETIQQQLMSKFDFIMDQFTKEIMNVEKEFSLGYALAPCLRSVSVQKDRLNRDYEAVQEMLRAYNTIVRKLTSAEFLKEHLAEVERHIQPGLIRFNWNSLGIEEYAKDCHQILKNLTSIVTQMEKFSQEVQGRIDSLESFNFFHFKKLELEAQRLSLKRYRLEKLAKFLKIYGELGPVLMKLEGLVLQSSTGSSQLMAYYFDFWEKKVFNCLIR